MSNINLLEKSLGNGVHFSTSAFGDMIVLTIIPDYEIEVRQRKNMKILSTKAIYERELAQLNLKSDGYMKIGPRAKHMHYWGNDLYGAGLVIALMSDEPNAEERLDFLVYTSAVKCYFNLLENNKEFRQEHLNSMDIDTKNECATTDLILKHKKELMKRLPRLTKIVLNGIKSRKE
jgi:hypothetical protein